MAHSLEVRVPYLDPVVAELALALPDQAQGARARQEAAAPPAVEPLLPREIARAANAASRSRRPPGSRGELEPFARDVLSRSPGRAGSSPRAVGRLLDRHVAGEEDLSRPLWGLLSFSLWHERWGS